MRPWLRRHAEPDREKQDRDVADRQLDHAQQVSEQIEKASVGLAVRRQENGFGESVVASMQPKTREWRLFFWDR